MTAKVRDADSLTMGQLFDRAGGAYPNEFLVC